MNMNQFCINICVNDNRTFLTIEKYLYKEFSKGYIPFKKLPRCHEDIYLISFFIYILLIISCLRLIFLRGKNKKNCHENCHAATEPFNFFVAVLPRVATFRGKVAKLELIIFQIFKRKKYVLVAKWQFFKVYRYFENVNYFFSNIYLLNVK